MLCVRLSMNINCDGEAHGLLHWKQIARCKLHVPIQCPAMCGQVNGGALKLNDRYIQQVPVVNCKGQ
jgi:hypothetical protein